MTMPGRRRWILWRLERVLRRSDPHLAAMLAIFARLAAGEAIASWEQRSRADRWMRRVLAAVAACARRAVRRIGSVCVAVPWWFRGRVRRTAGLPLR